MKKIFAISVLLLASCAPGGVFEPGKITKVKIDGEMIDVQPLHAPHTWAALPMKTYSDIFCCRVDPAMFAKNIKAIEKVSGCKVVPATVANDGMKTMAVVACK